MLAADPRLTLRRSDGEILAVLEYAGEPASLLYAAISCRIALASVAATTTPLYLSLEVSGVGRRAWRVAQHAETGALMLTRSELPEVLQRDEHPLQVAR